VNQEWWGIEFLEDGSYGKILNKSSSPNPILDNQDFIYLSTDLLYFIADKRYLAEITVKDKDIINSLVDSISRIGFKESVAVLIGESKIRLKDGNHRLIAAMRLGIKKMPVQFSKTTDLTGGSKNLLDVIIPLLEGKWQDQN
jgi:hypothetical protein